MLSNLITTVNHTFIWLKITLIVAGALAIGWGTYQGWNMSMDVTDLNVSVYKSK